MEQTTKSAPMDGSFPHSSAHVSLGPRRMDHRQYFPTHQKYLTIDRGSFVGSKMIVFTRWKHANFIRVGSPVHKDLNMLRLLMFI